MEKDGESSSLKTWVLLLLVSIFLILLIPSFPCSIFGGFRPGHAKKGWDAVNLALVVFAILCGLLGSGGGGGEYREEGEKVLVSSAGLEERIYEANQSVGIRRMRSGSSYDLNEWVISGDPEVRAIRADIFEVSKSRLMSRSPSAKTLSPPPPPPPPPPRRGTKGQFGVASFRGSAAKYSQEFNFDQSNSQKAAAESDFQRAQLCQTNPKITSPLQPAIPPPPPPPPPPPLVFPQLKKKSHKKRSGAVAKDIATSIAQFYNKKTRRNKTKKIHDDDSLAFRFSSTPPLPPPPPPPPPPPFVFSHLFSTKKGGSKSKRFNSISDYRTSPPPPPPPPPPPSFFPDHRFPPAKKKEKIPTFMNTYPIAPPSPLPPPPPPPPPPSFFSDHRFPSAKKKEKKPTFMNTYPIAPPSPLPPPPPPPPPSPPPSCIKDGGRAKFAIEEKASPFCSSPDVNNQADVFIQRFRHGLKLEKLREKGRRRQHQPPEMLQEAGIEMEMEQQILAMMMMGIDDNINY